MSRAHPGPSAEALDFGYALVAATFTLITPSAIDPGGHLFSNLIPDDASKRR